MQLEAISHCRASGNLWSSVGLSVPKITSVARGYLRCLATGCHLRRIRFVLSVIRSISNSSPDAGRRNKRTKSSWTYHGLRFFWSIANSASYSATALTTVETSTNPCKELYVVFTLVTSFNSIWISGKPAKDWTTALDNANPHRPHISTKSFKTQRALTLMN